MTTALDPRLAESLNGLRDAIDNVLAAAAAASAPAAAYDPTVPPPGYAPKMTGPTWDETKTRVLAMVEALQPIPDGALGERIDRFYASGRTGMRRGYTRAYEGKEPLLTHSDAGWVLSERGKENLARRRKDFEALGIRI